jgi:hypothetical protein
MIPSLIDYEILDSIQYICPDHVAIVYSQLQMQNHNLPQCPSPGRLLFSEISFKGRGQLPVSSIVSPVLHGRSKVQ